MPGSFVKTDGFNPDDYKDIEISSRTTAVDYKQIRNDAIRILGSKTDAVMFALKLNTQGMKLKADDYYKINGRKVMLIDKLDLIKKQEGYTDNGQTLGKNSSKKLLSLARIARAFADETTQILKINPNVKLDPTLEDFAKECGLDRKYAFLGSAYGMSDKELKENGNKLYNFAVMFDDMIDNAYSKGWMSGTNKRSHAEALANYIQFRRVEINEE